MELKDILSSIGIIITLLTVIKGVYEYQKAQKWKKLEFLAKEIKDFFNDFDNKRAMLLLDWNRVSIPVQDGELQTSVKQVILDDDILITALVHHSKKRNLDLTEEEILVRKIFDQFLFKLGVFNQYITTGLFSEKDLKPYLIYWVELIAKIDGKRKSIALTSQLCEYVTEYEFSDVIELCKRYGHNVKNHNS